MTKFLLGFIFSAPLLLSSLLPTSAASCCLCAPKNKPSEKICITTAVQKCPDLPAQSSSAAIKNLQCDLANLKASECKPQGPEKGLCPLGPVAESAYTPAISSDSGSTPLQGVIVPKLGVPIPGLTFSSTLEERGGKISIPFLAQYISAIYRYLTGIAVVAAAIMIVYGGFKYIVASSGMGVKSGREIISDAVIGLILVLSAYLLVSTVNPKTVHLRALDVTTIKTQVHKIPDSTYQRVQDIARVSGYTPDPTISAALQAYSQGEKIKNPLFPDNPFDGRTSIPQDELDKILDQIAKARNVDACILKAIVATEAGRQQNTIGHPENALFAEIEERLTFLHSGISHKQKPFATPNLPAVCDASTAEACKKAVQNSVAIKNDDELTPNPPDYGLDWRFSHSFGVAQCTIPATATCKGQDGSRGVLVGSACFTVPILLTWEGQLDCLSAKIKSISAPEPCAIFQAYTGIKSDVTCSGPLYKKMKAYEDCKD